MSDGDEKGDPPGQVNREEFPSKPRTSGSSEHGSEWNPAGDEPGLANTATDWSSAEKQAERGKETASRP
jgi:hypothetical protein